MRLLLASIPLAAAMDDESRTLFYAAMAQHISRVAIGVCSGVLYLTGYLVVALSTAISGPSMGITRMLWLVMRNDAAISPKVPWI
jgi:hypothetical protein